MANALYAEIDRLRFVEDTRLEARDALQAIVTAYDAVREQEGAKIPTMLHCAIEVARGKL